MKKTFADPDLGTKITRVSRRSSNITIAGKLLVWNDTHKTSEFVSLALTAPRALLEQVLEEARKTPGEIGGKYALAVWCALALWQAAVHGTHTRKRDLSLKVSPSSSCRLKLRRLDLPVLARFFRGNPPPVSSPDELAREFAEVVRALPAAWEQAVSLDPAPPWLHLERLASVFAVWFLSPQTLPAALRPPHGKAVAISPLTSRIATTLFIYNELVRLADTDDEVHGKIVAMLAPFDRDSEVAAYLERYRGRQATAVILTHLWLRREREKAECLMLLDADPRSIFRRYVYKGGRQKDFALMLAGAAQDPVFYRDVIVASWIREYLTPPMP